MLLTEVCGLNLHKTFVTATSNSTQSTNEPYSVLAVFVQSRDQLARAYSSGQVVKFHVEITILTISKYKNLCTYYFIEKCNFFADYSFNEVEHYKK